MKNSFSLRLLIFASVLSLTAFTTGCSRSDASSRDDHDHAHHEHEALACSYKEGQGLELSPAGAKFIDLRTVAFDGRLPAEALLRTVKGDFVFVQNGSRLLRSPVQVGPMVAGHYAVSDGLYEGDIVVVSGVQHLWLAELQAVNGGVGCADGH